MRLAYVSGLFGALLMVALFAGCKQVDGERCQIDSDCEEGLICCVLPNKTTKGTCREKSRCTATDSGLPDSTVKLDGKTPDQEVFLDQKVTTPDQKITTPDQKVTTPDQKVTTPDQKVTIPDQKVTTPDQTVTSPDQKVATPDQKVSADK